MKNLPKKIKVYNSNGGERISYKFKFHLKKPLKYGANTNNEAFCGYYPIGGNNGQLRYKLSEVNCKKCLMLYGYLKATKKIKMPWM
jgi:hypothetical protein